METVLQICTILGGLAALVFFYDRYKSRLSGIRSPHELGRTQKLMMLAGSLGGFIPGLSYYFFGLAGYWGAMFTIAIGGTFLSPWVEGKALPPNAYTQAFIERRQPPAPNVAYILASQMLLVGGLFNLVVMFVTGMLFIGIISRLAHFDMEDPQKSPAVAFVILLMTITGLAWGYALRNVFEDEKASQTK